MAEPSLSSSPASAASSGSGYPLGPAFDDFLLASVGDERNGMRLSVLTAMSRLNIDPWREAAKLAALPAATAAERLASLLHSLPDRPGDGDDAAIARRLVALLPDRAARRAAAARPQTAGRRSLAFTFASTKARVRLALLLAVLAGLAYVMTHQPDPAPGPETQQSAPVDPTRR